MRSGLVFFPTNSAPWAVRSQFVGRMAGPGSDEQLSPRSRSCIGRPSPGVHEDFRKCTSRGRPIVAACSGTGAEGSPLRRRGTQRWSPKRQRPGRCDVRRKFGRPRFRPRAVAEFVRAIQQRAWQANTTPISHKDVGGSDRRPRQWLVDEQLLRRSADGFFVARRRPGPRENRSLQSLEKKQYGDLIGSPAVSSRRVPAL